MMNGKTRATTRLVNLLIVFVCRLAGNSVYGELLPDHVPLSRTTSINPLMPNNEQSVKDCLYTNYPYATRGLASSIFAEPYRDKTFAHVVKLDTVEESDCVGVIVDQLHILTTKQCAQLQPQTISFQNETLPRWGILNTKYHISLDVAILQLRTNLSIDEQTTPTCFWNAAASDGFSSLQHIARDNHIDNFTISTTKCERSLRRQCYENSRMKPNGFVQVQAISNYREHPFLLALGSGSDGSLLEVSQYLNWIQTETRGYNFVQAISNYREHPFLLALGSGSDGSLLEVSQYLNWIQTETGTSVDPIECAIRYYRLREYDDHVAVRDSGFRTVQLQNAYVSSATNNKYKAIIGHYVEDPVIETVVTYSCYGTLIHRQFVLTSADCIDSFKNESLIVQMNQEKKFQLSSDPEYLLQEKSNYLEQVTVSQVFMHPEFSKAPLKNDLAILQLDPVELKFNQYFRPACLWPHESLDIKQFQTNGHGPLRTVQTLEDRVELLIKDRTETELYLISKVLKDCPMELSNDQVCVGEDATLVPGTCKSNQGSAMSREVGPILDAYYGYVFAISSKGEDCGLNAPSTFTRIAPHMKWIDGVIFGDNVQFNNSDIYYGDECLLHNSASGVCLTVPECPGIVDELTGPSTAQVKNCGFMKDEVLVCCSASDSAQNTELSSTRLDEIVQEIEDCPNLYADLRNNRSPYDFRKGQVTFLGLIKSHSSSTTCDATLISKSFVITSASCLKRFSSDERLFVLIGQNTTQQSDVEKTVVHPLYDLGSHENNLALLKLMLAVTVSQEVIPACLWKSRSHVPFALEILGNKDQLFDLQAYPLYQQRCEELRFPNVTSTELCVAFEGYYGRDKPSICHDAGSGAYNYFAHGLYERQVAYLVGVYTRGTDCEDDAIAVFTRVSHHFGWIKSVVYRLA